ncbi:VanZ family protein [Kitasatospora sp. NPDC051170]|uniref:VanZ family protein n=1 Tax=Kitasatospora sp. NPDC051170 TaxID=3364056 RepID=UPI003795C31A
MRTETGPTAVVHRPLRLIGLAGLACHLAVVLWLVVLRPLPVAWVYDANLTPLASLRSSTGWQVAGELLLLAPLGVLLPLAGGRVRAGWLPSFLRTTGASAMLATGLEFLSSWTPGHVLNVDHILLAVIGVAVTHLAFVPGLRHVLRERLTAAARRAASEDGQAGAAVRIAPTADRATVHAVTPVVTPVVALAPRPRAYAEPTPPAP